MTTATGSAAAVHPTEAADFDVTFSDGHHESKHGLTATNAALSAGAEFAVEQEAANWYGAIAAEYRPEAEARPVIDLNEALAAAMEQYRTEAGDGAS